MRSVAASPSAKRVAAGECVFFDRDREGEEKPAWDKRAREGIVLGVCSRCGNRLSALRAEKVCAPRG